LEPAAPGNRLTKGVCGPIVNRNDCRRGDALRVVEEANPGFRVTRRFMFAMGDDHGSIS
jgi:hypothetical protein